MSDLKLPPPRPLQHNETLSSLDQFKSSFLLFYGRSKSMREFFKPGATWDPTRLNYGLRDDLDNEGHVTIDAEEKCKI